MTRPEITHQDINRLLSEQVSSPVMPQDWFEVNGFEQDVMLLLIESSRKGMVELMLQAVLDGDDDDPKKMLGNIAATFMLSGFSLGWECHRQFAGRPDG